MELISKSWGAYVPSEARYVSEAEKNREYLDEIAEVLRNESNDRSKMNAISSIVSRWKSNL